MLKHIKVLSKKSPSKIIHRIIGAVQRRIQQRSLLTKDRFFSSYYKTNTALTPFFFGYTPIVQSKSNALATHFMNHEFDLLGSGWAAVHYGINCAGVDNHHYSPHSKVQSDTQGAWLDNHINKANLSHSKYIWQQIATGPNAHSTYQPIDWQLDFKSGYRWGAQTHVNAIPYGHKPGVDIKIPWELSRLQHLPVLALEAENQEHVINEVRAQILDFVALNPPRYGVNWRCPMDVAIRIVNLVMTQNLLGKLDDGYEIILANAIQAHVDYVLAHLEWSEEARGNHYFSNILGLLFGASALEKTPRNKAILAFSIQEFFIEADRQFLDDGTSFEGSTGYHRLSAEMLYWGCALILGLDGDVSQYDPKPIRVRPPFKANAIRVENNKVVIPDKVIDTCVKSAQFIADTTLPNGLSIKIGDYDSGRLLKLFPPIENNTEIILDHSPALSLAKALFEPVETGDGAILCALSQNRFLSKVPIEAQNIASQSLKLNSVDKVKTVFSITIPDHMETSFYPDFGLYIWKAKDFMLTVRCYSDRGLHEWGHFHDDNLAITLFAGDEVLIADPGTYLYTSMPEERKAYQAATAHFTPRLENCPAMMFGPSLFEVKLQAKAKCYHFDSSNFVSVLEGKNWKLTRQIKITSKAIEITDMSLTNGKKLQRNSINLSLKDTLGYGKKSTRSLSSV